MIDSVFFEEQVRAMTPTLFRVSLSITRSDFDARDATQQTLLNAWKNRTAVTEEKFRPWLMRILVNESHNVLRSRRRATPAAPDSLVFERPMEQPSDLEIRDALMRLPEKLRLPLVLRYVEGYSENEAAAILKIPVTTLKGRLHRARLALQKEWIQGEEESDA